MIHTVIRSLLMLMYGATGVQPVHDPFARGEAVLRDDATLKDVVFVDDQFGWAVGNRGAIHHTQDGGKTWRDQSVRMNVTLEAVHFVNRRVGYVVGGSARPDGTGCYGVMLRTDDGGRRWLATPGLRVGWLHAVWADEQGNGWLLGEPSEMRAAGLWRFSKAGGRVRPASDRLVPTILSAAFDANGRGVAVGANGTCVALRQGEVAPERRRVSAEGRLSGVTMVGGRHACMVGDDATIFTTDDAGRTWTAAAWELPAGLREVVDLTDVAFADPQHGWAVGANGQYIVRTQDGGKTWRLCRTKLPTTFSAIHAIDVKTIIGVGEFGLIARSEDGGETWRAVGNGDRQVGALVIAAGSARRVWPVMAHLVGHYRCRVAYLRVTSDATPQGSVRWAANACGASAVRAFGDFPEPVSQWVQMSSSGRVQPVKSTVGLFRYWSGRLDRDAEDAMRRQIAAVVRNFRPTIVITDQGESAAGRDLVGTSVAWAALEAVNLAEVPDALPEQRQIGLEPHEVRRVLQIAASDAESPPKKREGGRAEIRVGLADALHALLGSDSRLAGLRAAGYLGLPMDDDALTIALRVVRDATMAQRPKRLLSGIRLDDAARHAWVPTIEDNEGLDKLKSVTNALTVASRLGQRRGDPSRLVQLAVRACEEFPGALAPADALYQAARQYQRLGNHAAATEVWRAYLDLGRAHPAWSSVAIRQAVVQASVERYMSMPVRPGDRRLEVRAALEWLKRLCAGHPHLLGRPELLFAQAHCHRMLAETVPARQLYRQCAVSDASGWTTASAAELWLMEPPDRRGESCPRNMVDARFTSVVPRIDGELDDAVWQGGSAPTLLRATGERPTDAVRSIARFAWDESHLYLAATIRTQPEWDPPPGRPTPKRDRLNSDWPVVEWFIDVDRDAATYYRIAVDASGNGLDAHNEDLTWTLPLQASAYAGAWRYVVDCQTGAWTIEMSVPMASLVPRQALAGQVWGVQVVRRPAYTEPRSVLAWLNPQAGREAMPQHFALVHLTGSR